MWIYLFIICGLCNGAFSVNSLCERKTSQACLVGEDDFKVFPANENELKDICNFAKTSLQCAVDFVDQCGKRNFDLFHSNYERLGKLMDAAVDICRPDSRLYSRVTRMLPCAERTLRSDEQMCRESSRVAFVNLERTMTNNKNALAEKDRLYQLYDCIYPVMRVNCFLVQTTKKCGAPARNTILEVLRKVGLLENNCLTSNRDEVMQLMEILQFLTEDEVYVKQLL